MKRKIRQAVLFFGDIILAFLALLITVRIGFWGRFSWQILQQHLLPFSILYLAWLIFFYVFGLYDLNLIRPKIAFFIRAGQCFLTCLIIGLIFFYLVPLFGITPKTNLFLNIVIFAVFALSWRRLFYFLFSSLYLRNLAFLGKGSLVKKIAKEIKANPQLGYKVVKFLDPGKNIFSQIEKNKIETLVIASELNGNPRLTKSLYKCLPLRINFVDLAQFYERILQKIPIDFIDKGWFLENLREGEKTVFDQAKRIGDIILASLIIAIVSPFWLIFSIIIKLEDKGPVFYKQQRMGKDKKIFWLIKFRSMKVGAEKGEAVWAKEKDPRVTRIGRILRRLHLDETAQMLNTLKGELSMVGPRPERPEFVKKLEKEIPFYHLRHMVRPGFTGWAQIKFRYTRTLEDSREKVQYDLYYIKNRSFLLDLGILLKTFYLFFRKE